MSTLADLPELVGFFSYSREDDEAFRGTLSALRDGIQRELSAQLGRSKTNFRLWQDQVAIAPGKLWETEIETAINQSVFFIPIVTPRAVNSKYCKFEFDTFLARESVLGRSDLVFPIVYITVAALENEAKWRDDPILSIIGRRQYVDWRPLRHVDVQTTVVREQIERLCRKIVDALSEPWVSPEKRRKLEEAEAKRRADEEEGRRRAEAEARQRAEDEARRQGAEAKRRADEEEGRRRAEAEARQRAEEERRRQEAETKRRAEQEHAFAAAKRADDVGAIDAFLSNYPKSRQSIEAQALREALVARDEACKAAMASDDAAVLKAFLRTYPSGSLTEKVRGRLRILEPQMVWRPSRRMLVGAACTAFMVIGIGGLIIYSDKTPSVMSPKSRHAPPPTVQPAPLPTVADDLVTCEKALKDEGIAACSRVIKSGSVKPDDLVRAHLFRGYQYFSKEDYDRAIADYNEAVKLDPKNVGGFRLRGDAYSAKRDYDYAITDFNEAVKLDPQSFQAFVGRGDAYRLKQDYERAIEDYNTAIKLDPKHAGVFAGRGNAYLSKQDYDRAIADYNEAIKLDPKDAWAFNDRGVAYYRKQDYDRAMEDYDEAIKLNPKDGMAFRNRGAAHYRKQDYYGAIDDFNEAIKLNPKDPSALFQRGLAYLYRGSLAAALWDVSRANEVDQKNAYYALWIDIIGQRSNLPSHLSQEASKVDMTTWPAPIIRMFLGQMSQAALLAAADDRDANKKKNQVCEANFYSGQLALRRGAKDEAARLFRRAAGDCPKTFDEWPAANAELRALGLAR